VRHKRAQVGLQQLGHAMQQEGRPWCRWRGGDPHQEAPTGKIDAAANEFAPKRTVHGAAAGEYRRADASKV